LLPEACLEGLDELIRRGIYSSRSAAIRFAIRDLLKGELWQQERVTLKEEVAMTRKGKARRHDHPVEIAVPVYDFKI